MEELLVEERGFDGKLSAAEEGGKISGGDGEGLRAGTREGLFGEGEAAETAGIDEAEFTAGGEMKDGVGVRGKREARVGNEEAAGHAEMHNPLGLCVRRDRFAFPGESFAVGGAASSGTRAFKIHNDVLADAADAGDAAARQCFGEDGGRSFEGLLMGREPGGEDDVSVKEAVDAVGDSFDFREFGHGPVLSVEADAA